MFGWFRKRSREPTAYERLRGTILGNESLGKVASYDNPDLGPSPFSHFLAARATGLACVEVRFHLLCFDMA